MDESLFMYAEDTEWCWRLAWHAVTGRDPAAATVDLISHGRLRLVLGGGWWRREHREFGYPFPSAGDRLASLADAVEILRRALSTSEPFRYVGRQHRTVQTAFHVGETAPPALREFRPETGLCGSSDQMMGRAAALAALEVDGTIGFVDGISGLQRLAEVLPRLRDAVGDEPRRNEENVVTGADRA